MREGIPSQEIIKNQDKYGNVPELNKINVPENEIPPADPNLTVQEELNEYYESAIKDYRRERDKKNDNASTEKDGSEEYHSPREKDGNIDWKKVWHMLDRDLPSREKVFPNNEDAGLSDYEIVARLNKYMADNKILLQDVSGVNIKEYPEIIDRRIRELILDINNTSWMRSIESGIGNRSVIDEQENEVEFARGFRRADLTLMMDRKDPKTELFIKKVSDEMEKLKQKYPSIKLDIKEIKEHLENRNLNKQDISLMSFGLYLSPSEEWRKKKKDEMGEDYFDDVPVDPEEEDIPIINTDLPEPNKFSTPEKYASAYAKAFRRYNFERNLFHQYWDRYKKKHKEYFHSEEAEKITNEFFDIIRSVVDDIEEE